MQMKMIVVMTWSDDDDESKMVFSANSKAPLSAPLADDVVTCAQPDWGPRALCKYSTLHTMHNCIYVQNAMCTIRWVSCAQRGRGPCTLWVLEHYLLHCFRWSNKSHQDSAKLQRQLRLNKFCPTRLSTCGHLYWTEPWLLSACTCGTVYQASVTSQMCWWDNRDCANIWSSKIDHLLAIALVCTMTSHHRCAETIETA